MRALLLVATVAMSLAGPVFAEDRAALGDGLLKEALERARTEEVAGVRARVLIVVACDAWAGDASRARALILEAWDAAVKADEESTNRAAEQRKAGKEADFAPDVRMQVLVATAPRSIELARELLGRDLKSADPEAATRRRLGLASRLLQDQADAALQVAEPELTTPSAGGLAFLAALRAKKPTVADEYFLRLVSAVAKDDASDPNTVSSLASFLYTPERFVTFNPDGGSSARSAGARMAAPDVAAEVRQAFFECAAKVLLRKRSPEEESKSTAGLYGRVRTIRYLLPAFEEGGAETEAKQLRAAADELDPQGVWTNPPELRILRSSPDRDAADREKQALDLLTATESADGRDDILLDVALLTAGRGELRARTFVGKMASAELRREAAGVVDATLTSAAVSAGDAEKAAGIALDGALRPLVKTWALVQAARLSRPSSGPRALKCDLAALDAARAIPEGDADRARALLAVAASLASDDAAAAWDVLAEAIRAANAASDFTGEDGRWGVSLKTERRSTQSSRAAREFDLAPAFAAFAPLDPARAVAAARSLGRPSLVTLSLAAIGEALKTGSAQAK